MRWARARATMAPPVAARGRPAVLMAVALLLITATLAWLSWVPRYQPAGPPLLAIGDGEPVEAVRVEAPAEEVRREDSVVVLGGDGGAARLRLAGVAAVEPEGATLRLAATLSGEGLVPGQGAGARVHLVGLDARGEPVWTRRHELARQAGDVSASTFETDVVIPAGVPAVMVAIEHGDGQGVLRVHGLELRPLDERPDFELGRLVLLGAWAGFGLWLLLATADGFLRWRLVLVVLLVGLPVIGAAAMQETRPGALLLGVVLDELGLELGFERLGHLGRALLFTLLGTGIAWARPYDVPGHQLLALWLMAIALEVLQALAVGRLVPVEGALVNVVGATLGFVLVQGPRTLLARREEA